jgi:hypothetical protein
MLLCIYVTMYLCNYVSMLLCIYVLGQAEIFPTLLSKDSSNSNSSKLVSRNLVSNACVIGPFSVLLGLGIYLSISNHIVYC